MESAGCKILTGKAYMERDNQGVSIVQKHVCRIWTGDTQVTMGDTSKGGGE